MLKSPKGGLINVALRDPSSLAVNLRTGYLWSKGDNSWVVSTLLGETTHFSSGDIKQICVIPFAHGWHRFAAILAMVYGERALFVPSFKGGITFGTTQWGKVCLPALGKNGESGVAPIDGSMLKSDQDSTCRNTLH